ncbi:MAG: DUF432 domain-containing protein [Candidatus Cloacimonetes bacterium]|nr:DUF432 domain-containing protein [Candidatus Cloacimonadota bacterium]
MIFGEHTIPCDINQSDLQITVLQAQNSFSYLRNCAGNIVEKLILMNLSDILIAPVEPINLPSPVASYLMIEFAREIMLEPETKQTVYLTFPIETGVFVGKKGKFELLDVFTFTKPRYTLYGEPRNGFICKYWKSRIFLEEPETDPMVEGIIKLDIDNASHEWVTVNKALFNGVGMKIYYNQNCVSMKAQMKVLEEEVAEIQFLSSALHKEMKKSPELYSLKRLSVVSKKAIMLEGI